ncbi:MAG: CdaR family protein [Vulcanimicrobiaceae bacterium]
MEIIRKNFKLKLLSVTLAIIGWAYFRFGSNPLISARFDQQLSVPITTINLPTGYVAHFTDKEAVVTVESRRSRPPIKPDEMKAVLDLAGKHSGIYNIPVELVAPSVVVQSLSPASVTLSIERIETRLLPVSVHYAGQAGKIVVGSLQTTPATATIRGPVSAISQVVTVRLDVPLPSQPQRYDAMVRPVPIDAAGLEVPGLQVAPNLVRVQVHFVAGTGNTR